MRESISIHDHRRRPRRWRWTLVLLVLVAAAFVALGGWRTGGRPRIEIASDLPGIGPRTTFSIDAAEPSRGLARVEVELVQGEKVHPLADKTYRPRPPWLFWGEATETDRLELPVAGHEMPGLETGEATIRARAWPAASWFREPPPVVAEKVLPVRLTPPSVGIESSQHYVAQGGSEVVVYRVGEATAASGVEVAGRFFPGHPLPSGTADERFAIFAVPFDVADPSTIRLTATDDVGNRAEVPFVDRFFPRPIHTDTIEVGDGFLAKAVPEILSHTPGLTDRGSLVDNYLEINGDLRQRDAAELDELATKSRDEILWHRPFEAMPNAQVMSSFADRRTYLHDGKVIDHQVHLGFDLASVERAPVPAANDGIVLLARYFGIYGNAVVLDHGAGLMSLYGHLSSIAVKEGDRVVRGQALGHTGATGLAGGDHLHFTMLVDGVPVTPVEWWDPHWIADRIARKLGAAWSFTP